MPVSNTAGAVAVEIAGSGGCALLSDATVACWGENYYGNCGTGEETAYYTSAQPVAELTDVVELSSYYYHVCARLEGGTVKCWGYNSDGQLGDGTTTDARTPVEVLGVTGVQQIAAGGSHSCALLEDGRVTCWGRGSEGQLGNGLGADSLYPVIVSDLEDATSLSCGGSHCCVVRTDGRAACWGRNSDGQLGDGTQDNALSPVNVAFP